MASIRLGQRPDGMFIATSKAQLILTETDKYSAHTLDQLPLTNLLLSKDMQDTYLALCQAERDSVQARKAYVKSLQSQLAPQAQTLLDNIETTHPEFFL